MLNFKTDVATGPTTSAEDEKNAAQLKERMAATASNTTAATKSLDLIPSVQITHDSTYKYVLIHASDHASDTEKTLVRGFDVPYHADVATPTIEELENCGFAVTVLGGGRISHSSTERTISIYGFSYSFGLPDHSITADLCRATFPGYECSWSNEGY
jgi:phosphohistidine phosphatase